MKTRIWVAAALALAGFGGRAAEKKAPPKTMLWSWYAADDFRSMAKQQVGVAYLALSLRIEGKDQVTPSPRAIPVRIPPGMYQMAVVRIDGLYLDGKPPSYGRRQGELVVRMIGEIVGFTHPQGLQIDFDAPRAAWPFYREVLTAVRARIGAGVWLSMTALVSWCGGRRGWMEGLPLDEIVPMAFYMGQATPAVATMLARGGEFPFAGCRGSLGVTVGPEYGRPAARPRKGERAYFFPERNQWSAELLTKSLGEYLP